MSIPLHFYIAALGFAALDWIAGARNLTRLTYFARPAMMLSLLAWMAQIGGFQGGLLWFSLGLLFLLAGDTLLMLPGERYPLGLAAFLLAHLAFIAGLNFPVLPPLSGAAGILALLVAATLWEVDHRILPGLQSPGLYGLRIPVVIYSIVISLMLLSALLALTRREWAITPALLVSSGGLLLFISDMMWAWNKFLHPLSHGRLRIHTTFHLGIALLVLGAALRFLFPI